MIELLVLPLIKGQLISEWLFDVSKKPTQKFDEFLPYNLFIG